jgi:hypothetical protein
LRGRDAALQILAGQKPGSGLRLACRPLVTPSKPSTLKNFKGLLMSVINKDTTFLGYRRENGRVGVRNHVIILPLDDLSNAAAEAVAHNIKGCMAIPHPYGRLQFGADLDLHFRTLIGAGCNPNVAAVVVIGIEDSWTKKVVDGIATTGKPVIGFGIEGHGDHDTIMKASKAAREYVQWASEKQREVCGISELWVSTKCGESDTTSGCGANPTVGNAFDKLHPLGNYAVLRRDLGNHRRRKNRGRPLRQRRGARPVHVHVQPLPGHDQPPQDQRPVRLAADQGQHRRRPDDHRGKSPGQHPEDRQGLHGRRRHRQGREAHAPGPVVHGLVQRRRRDGDLCAARAMPCTSSPRARAM